MIEKIISLLNSVTSKAVALKKPILWVVMAYLLAVAFIVVAVIVGWVALWYTSGNPNIPQGLQIIHELVGPSTVAFVTFIAGCFVDTNSNNIPDNMEKNVTTQNKTQEQREEDSGSKQQTVDYCPGRRKNKANGGLNS